MERQAEGPRCPTHPAAPANDVCVRCGTFLCRACRHLDRKLESYCGPCYARLDRRQSASTFAFLAAALGFFGLGCGPLGAVAIILGAVDLSLIAAGKAPDGGRKLDLIGLGLGAVGVLFGLVILARWREGSLG